MLNQRNPKWRNIKLGFGKSTIGSHGCFLTCLSYLAGTTPDKANEILKKANAFHKDLIISDRAAKALGLKYRPPARSVYYNPQSICIAEVDFSPAPGKQQHFVVWNGDGTISDPWDAKTKKNKYRIISFRLFDPIIKPKPMKELKHSIERSLKHSIEKITGEDYGKIMNEKEQKRAAKDLDEYRHFCNEVKQNHNDILKERNLAIETIDNLTKQVKDLTEAVRTLKKRNEKLDEANQTLTETVAELEKEFGKTLNSFKLGKWIIIIKETKWK